ncbi:hypothetical protein F1880_006194 [Penicillium rolfsii]|nr:hypothetical protein F1880_006194 [Penicillium rolfsii]
MIFLPPNLSRNSLTCIWKNSLAYEFFEVTHHAPNLALLGDIRVSLVQGNHEPWQPTWSKTRMESFESYDSVKNRRISNETATRPGGEFAFLDQIQCNLSPEIAILGCKLWFDVSKEYRECISFGINGFYCISDCNVGDHIRRHRADVEWLNS